MSKRLNGEGMVRKHPTKNLYEARYSYTDEVTGLRKRGSVYGKTANETLDKLKEAQKRIKANKPPKDSSLTVATWVDQWQQRILPSSPRKETTKELYVNLSTKHLKPAPFGELELRKVRASHIDDILLRIKSQGYAESTVRNIYAVLNSLFDGACRDNLMASNPLKEVPRPRVNKTEAKHLPPEEVRAILDASTGSRYESVFRLISATGVRRGEAAGLLWEDVDFTKNILRIRSTVARVNRELKATSPKTTNARRDIPMTSSVVALLKEHRKAQVTERLRAGNQWADNGLVFATEMGGYIDPRNMLRAFQKAAEKAGIEDVGLHTLRHSAATAMMDADVPMHVVSRILGHSSISITVDTYGHVTETSQRDAMEGLSEALGF